MEEGRDPQRFHLGSGDSRVRETAVERSTFWKSPSGNCRLEIDRRALELVSGGRAVRIHVEAVGRADGIGRERKARDSFAFIAGGDGAKLFDAFEIKKIGGVGRGRYGHLDRRVAAAVPGQPEVSTHIRRIAA